MKIKQCLGIGSVFILLAGLLGTVSCQRDDNGDFSSLSDYEKVGKLHNEGLEYVFNYIKENTSSTRAGTKRSNLKELSETAVSKFLKKKHLESIQTRSTYGDTDIDKILSLEQKMYYDKLISVVLDRSLNYEATQKAVTRVTKEIEQSLSPTDAAPLLYGAAIAKYTLEYWYTNWEKWRVEIGGVDALTFGVITRAETPESSNDDFSWKDVGKSDIAGGVGGAVGGAATGAMAGGVGALPGAGIGAVGGAVGGSVADAVGQLLGWL